MSSVCDCETDESFHSTKHHCRQLHHGHGHLVPRLPAVALRHLPGEVADRVGLVSPRRDHETFPGNNNEGGRQQQGRQAMFGLADKQEIKLSTKFRKTQYLEKVPNFQQKQENKLL